MTSIQVISATFGFDLLWTVLITFSGVFSAGIDIKMEKDKDSIMLSISDESSNYVGHLIICENPESPVESTDATPSESTNDLSDNESSTSTDSSA